MKVIHKPLLLSLLLPLGHMVLAPPSVGQGNVSRSDARTSAPVDLTGDWVSIVTQDWLFRMAVPQRGQYSNIPINAKAMAFADVWSRTRDEAAGKQCEAYGAPSIMQVPERLRVRWRDDNTLRVDTDAGTQTRLLRFDADRASGSEPPSWQGSTVAQWVFYAQRRGRPQTQQRPRFGWLRATTTNLLPGLLRKNGVPYSSETRMTENWLLNAENDGAQWLTVNTEVQDPVYLSGPYVENAIFRREGDDSKWDPTPCSLEW